MTNERGYVLVAALILSAVAASLTVAWARHAVLAKGRLEMGAGASEAEESARSGLERTRQQMRGGSAPGTSLEGLEDIVITSSGDTVTTERAVESYDRRVLTMRSRPESGGELKEAAITSRALIMPGSNASGGQVTTLRCDTGTAYMTGPDVTMISGSVSYTDATLSGLLVLMPGSTLTLEDVVLDGAIMSQAGMCKSVAPQTGGSRPLISLAGGVRIDSRDFDEVAIAAPDARLVSTATARVNIDGAIIANEIDLQCRGSVRGLVVVESQNEVIGSNIKRPGYAREPQDWSSTIVAGSERIVSISFPPRRFTASEIAYLDSIP